VKIEIFSREKRHSGPQQIFPSPKLGAWSPPLLIHLV